VKAAIVLFAGLALLVACSDGVPDGYATWDQIVEAADRCGVPDFKPTDANAAWAAYVPEDVPNHASKEDCIYHDLRERQGLLVTR
jgi:hypothetical protein